jgi:hypothetical protein
MGMDGNGWTDGRMDGRLMGCFFGFFSFSAQLKLQEDSTHHLRCLFVLVDFLDFAFDFDFFFSI